VRLKKTFPPILWCCATVVVLAAEPSSSPNSVSTNAGGWHIRLSAPTNTLAAGQPLTISVTIPNASSEKVSKRCQSGPLVNSPTPACALYPVERPRYFTGNDFSVLAAPVMTTPPPDHPPHSGSHPQTRAAAHAGAPETTGRRPQRRRPKSIVRSPPRVSATPTAPTRNGPENRRPELQHGKELRQPARPAPEARLNPRRRYAHFLAQACVASQPSAMRQGVADRARLGIGIP